MPLENNGKLPTVPEYYMAMIDRNVDLVVSRKQCCPFHQEDTPSFSYDIRTGRWRCFGKCQTGGDVYEMHKMNYRLNSREEAIASLNSICGVVEKKEMKTAYEEYKVDEDRIDEEVIFQKCLLYADCPERWLQLDYVMSKTPVDNNELRDLLNRWGVSTEGL